MGIFDRDLYDLDGDGKEDPLEAFAAMQMFATSRKEAIDLTGDDTFYTGDDDPEDEDDRDGLRDEFDDHADHDDFDDADDSDDWE